MQSKEKVHEVNLAIAMWFYDACIPINACNSPYFQLAVDKIASIGYGYKAPNYHALRVNLLKDAKTSVGLIIDSYRSDWVESGCTIMSDGWRDIRHRHLINFLVYCEKRISFLKSVDASDIESNTVNLCNLFAEVTEMVGVKNVVQIVTDNAANYKAAGKMLCAKYPSVTWTPCAAHCLNLWLKDVSELENVSKLVKLASRITVFIYNHKMPLNWLRKREGWTEIIRSGPTRFGTTFIALKSLVDHKNDLQALVISNEFKKMSKLGNATECKEVVMNETFWSNCLITVTVMAPLLRVLRLCDMDEKPSLPYVF
ncbi:putative ribonuclease H-like superfamily [Helianthus annuus]|nr:putative ribonuclease H-like superfamily [Helianthus annuus]